MSFKHKLALEASAGSGKTYALSVRYIALLLQGANPKHIVALTFTKKAANEMKSRVFETLESLHVKKSELKSLCELLDLGEEEVLKRAKDAFPLFSNSAINIETIDAFLGKILRKFSLNLGVLPDFLTQEATHERHLREYFLKEVQNSSFYDSLVVFASTQKKRLGDLFTLFSMLYEKDSEISTLNFPQVPYPCENEVMEKVRELKEYAEKKGGSKTAINSFVVNDVDALLGKSFLSRHSLEYRTFNKIYTLELDELYFELKEALRDYCSQKEAYLLGELFSLYKMYVQTRLNIAKNLGEVTFTDVANFVYKLMHGTIDSEFLYFRLDANIEHLLIDEFQDTNFVQFEILSPIIEEIISGLGTSGLGSFFYVGDTKQSIYRFRGGTKELFSEAANRFDVNVEALDTNYRSYGKVVGYVNEIFLKTIDKYIPQHVANNQNKGYVKVKAYEDALEGILKSVEELLESGVVSDDIAVLCWTNDDVKSIEEKLLTSFKSLHVSTESSMKLIHAQDVSAVLEYLKFCYFGDMIYAKNALTLSGVSWEENLFKPTVDWMKPLSLIIKEAIEFLKLDGCSVDLIRLMEVADSYEDIEDFIFELERIGESSSSKSKKGVRVLTVHKSKGLEFDYVIVADRLKGANNRGDTLLFDYDGVKLEGLFYRMKAREYVDESYASAKEKENSLSDEDKLNALYVAFTRAKKGLVVPFKEEKSTFDCLDLQECIEGEVEKSKIEEVQKEENLKLLDLQNYGRQEVLKTNDDEEGYEPKAVYFGRALHYLLEMIPSFDEVGLEVACESMINRYANTLEKADLDEVVKRAKSLLYNEEFQNLIKGKKILKEQPLMFEGERKQIDLLVEYDDKVVVIDYKSSAHVDEGHVKQVNLYKKAMEEISQKRVMAYLIYLRSEGIFIKNL